MTKAAKVAQVTRSPLEQRMVRVISEQLGVDEEAVTPDASFVKDLGADSLDCVELVMALEDEFNVVIDDEDVEHVDTMQAFLPVLARKGVAA